MQIYCDVKQRSIELFLARSLVNAENALKRFWPFLKKGESFVANLFLAQIQISGKDIVGHLLKDILQDALFKKRRSRRRAHMYTPHRNVQITTGFFGDLPHDPPKSF